MKDTLTRLVVMLFPLVTIISAQPGFPDDPPQGPIGGLGLLAAAGGALAIKKLWDKKRK